MYNIMTSGLLKCSQVSYICVKAYFFSYKNYCIIFLCKSSFFFFVPLKNNRIIIAICKHLNVNIAYIKTLLQIFTICSIFTTCLFLSSYPLLFFTCSFHWNLEKNTEKTFILYYITIFHLFLFYFYFTGDVLMFFISVLLFCSNLYFFFFVNFTLNSENDGEKEIFISSFVLVLIFCYNLCIIIFKRSKENICMWQNLFLYL
jgi:hypothetical protein